MILDTDHDDGNRVVGNSLQILGESQQILEHAEEIAVVNLFNVFAAKFGNNYVTQIIVENKHGSTTTYRLRED